MALPVTIYPALLVAALLCLGGSLLAAAVGMLLPRAVAVTTVGAGGGASVTGLGLPDRGVAHAAFLLGGAFVLVALVVRTIVVGHAPWSNLHETAVTFAFGLVAVFGVMERRVPIRGLAPVVAALAAGMLGVAFTQPSSVQPLVPALQAPLLLTIHVGAAILAYAVAGVAFAAAVAEIAQRRAGDRLAGLPTASVLRGVGHRAVLIGFPILTAAILLGSVWANLAWRSYWSNDPKELAAAATWLVYGAYLHLSGRRDRWAGAAPWLLVLGFVAVLFTYLGAGLVFVGEHSYAGS